jgi:PKD repeat protein
VHVIHNIPGGAIGGVNIPTQQIIDQIAVLNEDYRRKNSDTINTPALYASVASDVQLEFCLAVRDPNGDPTNGITRTYNSQATYAAFTDNIAIKSQSYWPSDQYLNIWVCDLASPALGYAQFPSDASDNNGPATTDGVVIDYSTFGQYVTTSTHYNLGRTTTHEVGHWLDLYHPWGDVSDCSGTDYCSDTPPCSDAYYSSKPTCVMPFQCGYSRMIQNYMDYSDDACMNMFTGDQKARMQSAMVVSPRRIAIQSSLGCCNTCYVPHANFTVSKTQPYIGETITFTSTSTGNINTYSWDFGSGAVPATATGIGPHTVYYPSSGPRTITLTTTGAYGTDTQTKTNYITVVYTAPAADFYASKTTGVHVNEAITFTNASTGVIDTYTWDFGPGAVPPTATGIGPHAVYYTTQGLKTVSLTDSSTTLGSNTKTKNLYISVLPVNDTTELHVYPSPANDVIALTMTFQNPTTVNVLIFDRLGKKVFDGETASTSEFNEVINVKEWADGLYIIKVITGDNKVSTFKLLVMK